MGVLGAQEGGTLEEDQRNCFQGGPGVGAVLEALEAQRKKKLQEGQDVFGVQLGVWRGLEKQKHVNEHAEFKLRFDHMVSMQHHSHSHGNRPVSLQSCHARLQTAFMATSPANHCETLHGQVEAHGLRAGAGSNSPQRHQMWAINGVCKNALQ